MYIYIRMQNCISNRLMKFLGPVMLTAFLSCSGNLSQTILFEDEFDYLQPGYISNANGHLMQYHYLRGSGQAGPWTISSFGPGKEYHTAWEIIEGKNGHFLRQNSSFLDENLAPYSRHVHPIIVAGDSIWHDYKVEFTFSPGQLFDKCGVVFKYHDSRSYYFYGMEGNMLILKMVNNATAPYRPFEKVLASVPFRWKEGKIYKGEVSVKQNRIYTLLNDSLSMIAEDNTFTRGKVGFLSDVPADFYGMEVTTLNREIRKLNRYMSRIATSRAQHINENGYPVIWKKISTEGFGTGNNLRFGDLKGDGEVDILIGQIRHIPQGQPSYDINCLTAITFDGNILWQKGVPDPESQPVSGDIGLQIHDIDGDGSREVIAVIDSRINIFEGRSGRMIRSVNLPLNRDTRSELESSPGYSILFCDLQGKGRDSNIIICDGYVNIWAYDEHLKLLWKQKFERGKYPFASDVDNDGKDEIITGYSLIDDDGTVLWNKSNTLGGHVNAVTAAIFHPEKDTALRIAIGAGDWGTILLDHDGNTILHHPVGHVQNASIANFKADLPGLEMVTVNSWGGQGIINLYDSQGNIYKTFEPGPHGSNCFPVNWRGDGVEYFLLNTNSGDGGLFNGDGQLVVAFPDDGHPELCNAVLDVTGDYRDEIITWDQQEIWVYTQIDNNRQGKIYYPERNPTYNASNYQLTLSKPRWID